MLLKGCEALEPQKIRTNILKCLLSVLLKHLHFLLSEPTPSLGEGEPFFWVAEQTSRTAMIGRETVTLKTGMSSLGLCISLSLLLKTPMNVRTVQVCYLTIMPVTGLKWL